MKCVILAGGSGDSLWPLSRRQFPKQFMKIKEGRSILQETVVRNMPFCEEFIIVTNESYKNIVNGQMKAFQSLKYRVILEGTPKGTGAAVLLGTMFANPSELVLVVNSDNLIEGDGYKDSIIEAKEYAKEGNIANIINEKEHIGIYICQVGIYNKMVSELYPDINSEKRKSLKKSLRSVRHVIHVPLEKNNGQVKVYFLEHVQ